MELMTETLHSLRDCLLRQRIKLDVGSFSHKLKYNDNNITYIAYIALRIFIGLKEVKFGHAQPKIIDC